MFIKQFDIVRLRNVRLISIVLTKSFELIPYRKKVRNFFSLYEFFLQCLYGFLRKSSGNTDDQAFVNSFVKLQVSKFCEGSVRTHVVHCMTTWHNICVNYAGIIVSHYQHLFRLWSLVSEFLQPRSIFSLPNLTLRYQFGFEVTHQNFIDSDCLLQECKSFVFVTSQMFLNSSTRHCFCAGNSTCKICPQTKNAGVINSLVKK